MSKLREEAEKYASTYPQNSSFDWYSLRHGYMAAFEGPTIKALMEGLKAILEPERLRDRNFLASKPPLNAAVYDIQVIARNILAMLEEDGK